MIELEFLFADLAEWSGSRLELGEHLIFGDLAWLIGGNLKNKT